ncbi:DUF4058 family protein [Nodosilinea nodulosa]|uniref:DUF4058 family protein n=1 Tax=Nodosilinea nodulosa TaxID=416001 RepID=UPI0021F83E8F
MPSPLPGMDPYLEHPQSWPNFHHRLITAIAPYLLWRQQMSSGWRSGCTSRGCDSCESISYPGRKRQYSRGQPISSLTGKRFIRSLASRAAVRSPSLM